MNETAKHDPDAGFEPAFPAPPNACDAHFHVFGAAERYPYGTDIRYKPPFEPLQAYLKLARRIGFMRYVFVQPSAYGFDNSCMLDAMRALDAGVRRGIIDLHETKTNDKELAELNALGVRGIRVEEPSQIAPALRDALASDETVVVDVATDINARAPEPWLPAGA